MVHKTISFPSEGRCIVIINQSFTIKLKWPIKTNSSETVLPPLIKTEVARGGGKDWDGRYYHVNLSHGSKETVTGAV